MFSNIYVITNHINNKKYIGQSIDVIFRWKQHLRDSKNKKKNNKYLYRAMNKYNIENFSIEIIESEIPLESIDEKEQYWIEYYNTFTPNGYNLTKGGEGGKGRKKSKEEREKISTKVLKWQNDNKEKFLEMIKNRDLSNCFTDEAKNKRSKTWKLNPKNKEIVLQNLKTYRDNCSEEKKKQDNEKAVKTKKEKGYDFYEFSFGKMNEQEKKSMYEKISKNNKRSQAILMLNIDNKVLKEFHSIGEAGRYLHENHGYGKNCKANIRQVLNTNKITYGFKWKHK